MSRFLFFLFLLPGPLAFAQVDTSGGAGDTIYVIEEPVVITDYYFLPPKITRNWFVSAGFAAGKGLQHSHGISFNTTFMPFIQVGRSKNKWTALIGIQYQNTSGVFVYEDTSRYELFHLKYLNVPVEVRYRILMKRISISPALGFSPSFLLAGSTAGLEYKTLEFKRTLYWAMFGIGTGYRFNDKFGIEFFVQAHHKISELSDKEKASVLLLLSGVRFNYFFK